MGPQDPKEVTRNIARDLTGLAGELAALEADARHWLTDPRYMQTYIYAWETPHAAVEAALVEARPSRR